MCDLSHFIIYLSPCQEFDSNYPLNVKMGKHNSGTCTLGHTIRHQLSILAHILVLRKLDSFHLGGGSFTYDGNENET